MGVSQQEYWSGLPFLPSGILPDPEIELTSPACQVDSLPLSNLGSPFKGCQFSSVQFSHSVVSDFATPWTAACQASLSITNSRSLLKLMSIALVMLSNHLILGRLLLLSPSIFPSIRVFSKESVFHIRWPKYWSFSFSISPSNEQSGLISFIKHCWFDDAYSGYF